ncbi:MAG: cell envelope integrity protein CreD, partial [Pseudomonadota bacterium]
ALDDFGRTRTRLEEETKVVQRASLYLLPERFDVTLTSQSDVRQRGIFRVPVYRADMVARFDFDTENLALSEAFTIRWQDAELFFGVSSNRALRGEAALVAGSETLRIEPWARDRFGGISAKVGDPRARQSYELRIGFQGSERLEIAPVGRTSRIEMESDWPHPSFGGSFLPDGSQISDDGFAASWTIPHLARPLPQRARESQINTAESSAFGVRFFQPNDFYQKAYRAARYGILFISLTFLTVLLIERSNARPTHPVQYIMIGLVQAMFVVLMVAYAEQIGFGAAYLMSSVAVIGLITLFGALALKLGKRTFVLGAMLCVLYALLFLILRSADYALIAGATLVFVALAGAMIGTRNEEWYGPDGPRAGLFRARETRPKAASGESSL